VDGRPRNVKVARKKSSEYDGKASVDLSELELPYFQVRTASAIFICFSIDNPSSLEEAKVDIAPRLKYREERLQRKRPVFLVGLQADRRQKRVKNGGSILSDDQIEQASNEMGVVTFRAVSSKTGEGINNLLEVALREIATAQTFESHIAELESVEGGSVIRKMRPARAPMKEKIDEIPIRKKKIPDGTHSNEGGVGEMNRVSGPQKKSSLKKNVDD